MQITCKSICIVRTKICVNASDRHVHLCHFPSIRIGFLSINRNGTSFMAMCFNKLFALHKHTAGTTAAIIYSAVIKRTKNRNQCFYYTGWCIKFSTANSFFFCKLRYAIFISTSEKILAGFCITHINAICEDVNHITQNSFVQIRACIIFRKNILQFLIF